MSQAKQLHDAIRSSKLSDVKKIISDNPELVNISYRGEYPLIEALRIDKDISTYLLDHGAIININDIISSIRNSVSDSTDTTCFEFLLRNNPSLLTDDEVYRILDYIPNYSKCYEYTDVLNKYYQKTIIRVLNRTNLGPFNQSLLQMSALFARINTIKDLLRLGANPNLRNNEGDTTMHIISNNNVLSRDYSILHFIKNGGDRNLEETRISLISRDEFFHDIVKIARLLINSGADVTIKNNKDETAEDIARNKGNIELADTIKEYGTVDIKEHEFM